MVVVKRNVAARLALMSGLLVGAFAPLRAQTAPSDIVLPVDLSSVTGSDIAVEIDGTDLTEFVRIEDGQLVVSASAALTPGAHLATVYILRGGNYVVFASYSFDTSAPSAVSVEVQADHEAGVTSVNGAVEGHAASAGTVTVETVDQSVTARVAYVADTRDENQINGHFADIAEYSIDITQSGALLDLAGHIGHQSLGFDKALIAELNRRGLSVEGTRPGERLQFTLFALKSTDALGAANLLGLAEEDDRMFGGRLALRPFTGSDFRVSLQGYQGQGSPDFSLESGTGAGRGLSFDGSLAEGRLRYDLSFATAHWDEDQEGPLPEDDGDALLAALAYDIQPANGSILTLGLEYEKIDLFYFSLANPGLPTGGETLRLTGDYSADRLSLFGSLETTLTNEGGDSDYPIDRVNKIYLDGSWALLGPGFLSDASLSFGGSRETIRRVQSPLGQEPEDWTADELHVALDTSGETAAWSVGYSWLRENDQTDNNFDLTGHEVFATLALEASERLTVDANVRVGRFDSPADGDYGLFEGQIGVDYALDPGLWALSVDLGLTTTGQSGVEGGAFVASELKRDLRNGAELVFNAGWYDGAYATETGLGGETVVGFVVRLRQDVFR
jgi:hypothetical protein